MQGKFIVFEGIDGAGLSTQSMRLREHLASKGLKTVLTKEQTDSLIGGLIKSCLRKEWITDALTLQLLFAADRQHHLKTEIEPALRKGKHIICDRYVLSTLAYGGLDMDMKFFKKINSKFRKPDIVFIIDIQPEVSLKRIAENRHHIELFEQKEKLENVRKNYLSLKNYYPNTHIIEGDRKIDEVFGQIKAIVDRNL
ncbi:MAG: dTMP kinase [Candidatus Aenigmarchaeota archaeon]|nr:dTMP kinase [Candidatus Aenigmarchaeota archaeon]